MSGMGGLRGVWPQLLALISCVCVALRDSGPISGHWWISLELHSCISLHLNDFQMNDRYHFWMALHGILWKPEKEEISCEVTCMRASQLPVLKLQDQRHDLWPLGKCHFLDFRCHLCFSAHSIYFPPLSLNALFIVPWPPVNITAFYHHSKQFHKTRGIS